MRLGFCGVGRWASKIAEQFHACGAEIVAYDRKTRPEHGGSAQDERVFGMPHGTLSGFIRYQPWRDQVEDPRIDAIIAMADPETTTAVALACAAAGKPCMATKPLMLTEMPTIRAPLYVDFWRLWGDRWKRARWGIGRSPIVDISLNGNGPLRSFPGALDYGPHAFAFALDSHVWKDGAFSAKSGTGKNGGEWCEVEQVRGDRRVRLNFGNGYSQSVRQVMLSRGTPVWYEPPNIDPEVKNAEIRAMCQSFLDDIHESNANTYTLDLSVRGMRILQEMREKAK